MKVLYVSGEFPPQAGGVGDYTDRLAGALSERGDEVAVLTTATVGGEIPNGDAVWANQEGAVVWRSVRHWNLRAWRILAAQCQAWRPDIVHLQYQAAAYGLRGEVALFPRLFRLWNIRPLVVVTFHDLLPPHSFPLSGRLGVDRRAVLVLGRGADGAIATNADDARRLMTWGVRRVWEVPIGANILVAPNVDVQTVRADLGVAADAPLLAYFGFYNASKGLEELLTAFAALGQELPAAKLLLIGGGTGWTDPTNKPYAAFLHRRAQELAITYRLVWTGYVDAGGVSAYLQAATTVVLPFRDGVSLRRGTLMAALSHGCAIVSTNPLTPVPQLDQTVVLCRPNDALDLQRAISASLDPVMQRRLRGAALAAAADFSWSAIAAAHSAVYQALCHSNA